MINYDPSEVSADKLSGQYFPMQGYGQEIIYKNLYCKAHPRNQSKYKARHAHKRLYTVLPKYSKIQVLPGITSCRLVKDNKQAIELNSLLINNMPKDGYE